MKKTHGVYLGICCSFVFSILLFCVTVLAEETTDLKLYARSAVLMDGATGRILYATDNQESMPMASTTKIMTCILALENGNPDDLVEISANAASQPDVQMNAKEGEVYRLEDLLYSLMLESHNDAAVAIAEHIGKSVEGFASLMNQKARDLGCNDTWFITPNGLDAQNEESGKVHETTAKDLAEILRYCAFQSPKREEFLTITQADSRTFSDREHKRVVSCLNHNAFLHMMPGMLTGKTGFTGKAGYCYVGAMEEGEKQFIIALLGCGWPPHKTYKWTDARKLLEYGLSEYTYRKFELQQEGQTNEKKVYIPVENGKTEKMDEMAQVEIRVETTPFGMLMREDEMVEVNWKVPNVLSAPVWKGMPVGVAEYKIDGVTWKTDTIVAESNIEKIDWQWCLEQVLQHLFAI